MSGSAPDDPPPPEATPGRRTDLGVEVTRELGGGGRLARGSGTRYSTLKFSSRGVPREEAAPPDDAPRIEEAPERTGRAQAGAPATPAVADAERVLAPEAPRPGLLGRMAGLLGLRGTK